VTAYKVVSSTMGVSTPDLDAKPYRWRGVPGWRPGDARFREPAPRRATEAELAGLREASRLNSAGRAARIAEFARLCAEEGMTPPEAGREIGVTAPTARAYWRAIQKQQQGEAPS
jgi:hypothetical protein